jgi:toxin-antitoxin system PIN domain toxin
VIAVDTNLLVYAHRAAVVEHRAARRALERVANESPGWGITVASVAEFWAVVTHPASTGRPSTPKEAAAFLESLIRDGGAQLWVPGTAFAQRFMGAAVSLAVRGPRIFDLQIALTAIDNGAREIWTHDRDFVSVPGLRVRHPLD